MKATLLIIYYFAGLAVAGITLLNSSFESWAATWLLVCASALFVLGFGVVGCLGLGTPRTQDVIGWGSLFALIALAMFSISFRAESAPATLAANGVFLTMAFFRAVVVPIRQLL